MADQYVNLRPGLNNVGNYQVSGIPFVSGGLTAPANTSASLAITFPSVTQRIIVHNNNSDNSKAIKIGFSAAGVSGSNAWILEPHGTNGKSNDRVEIRVKTNKLFIISADNSAVTDVYVLAELTGITGYDLATAYSGSTGIG